MLGLLPTTIEVNGSVYKIRTDYRDILRIISACNDQSLSDSEKVYVCMKQIYIDLDKIPEKDFEAAYIAAISFMECRMQDDRPSPRVVNWEKDEQLIFPAVNKAAGFEVRAVKYMHWWTFLGYFQNIDRDDIWGFILTIRQKRAKHKQLEKHEKEFYAANRLLCEVDDPREAAARNDKTMLDIYSALLKEVQSNG